MSCGVFVFVLCQKDDENRNGREEKNRRLQRVKWKEEGKETGKGKLDKAALRLG
jgi:hypothetical protein